MSNQRIRSIFERHLQQWADTNDYPIAFENTPFNDTKNVHLRAYLLPARTSGQFLDGKHSAYVGVFQISVVVPNTVEETIGAGRAQDIADAIEPLFPQWARFTDSSGFTVVVSSPVSSAPGIQIENAYAIPTSFTYRADVTR